jgi:hypothetical protein
MSTTFEGCNEKELRRGAAGNSRALQATPLQRQIEFESEGNWAWAASQFSGRCRPDLYLNGYTSRMSDL